MMKTCDKYGENCVGCGYEHCIDDRQCFGMCSSCINKDCENHPRMIDALCGTGNF